MLIQKINQLPKISAVPNIISLDFETHPDETIEGFSFAYMIDKKIVSYYCPLSDMELDYTETVYANLPIEFMMKYLQSLVMNRKLVMHNAQFDCRIMLKAGIKYKSENIECTMLLHYSIDTERRHGLKPIMQFEYGVKDIIGYKEAKKEGFEIFSKYADNDAVYTLRLYIDLLKQCKSLPKQYVCYRKFEIPFIEVLHRMNYIENRIRIDEQLLSKYVGMVEAEINMVENILQESLGDINFSSTSQLAEVLSGKGYELEYTDKGNPSLSDTKIHKLASKYKDTVFLSLSYHRKLKKIATSYVFPLYEQLVLLRKDVYVLEGYEFIHIGTRTGRLSAHNPSLQVIPRDPIIMRLQFVKALQRASIAKDSDLIVADKVIDRMNRSKNEKVIEIKEEHSVDIRKIFIPMPGKMFIGADFSQIELRMVAHLANDKHMIEEFSKEDADIHKKTAEEVSALIGQTVERQYAKPINFGILYGLWHTTFARQMGISIKKAKAMFEGWWNFYIDIKIYVKEIHKNARGTGYVSTILGRRRSAIAMGINMFDNFHLMKYAENSCVSHRVSGSSADLIKVAMLNIHKKYPEVIMRIQVHDELLFEVEKKEVKKYAEIVKYEMENAMKLKVPVVVDILQGMTWREVH